MSVLVHVAGEVSTHELLSTTLLCTHQSLRTDTDIKTCHILNRIGRHPQTCRWHWSSNFRYISI